MLKQEKMVIEFLISEFPIGKRVDTRDFYDKINLTPKEVDSVCDALNDRGLLGKYSQFMDGGRLLTVTYQLVSYWNSNKNSALRYVIESVIIPIVLGVVSSVVTTLILNALGF